jgi:HK97 family phage portal protein
MGGLFGGLAGAFAGPAELKMSSRELDALLRGGHQSASGATVNWSTALQVSTVLACCKVIAEGIAQVPWKIHLGIGGGSAAADHPLYDVLYRRPNGWQTSFEFRETLAFHVLLTGNAFAWKGRVGMAREIRTLEPIVPGTMTVQREPVGRLRYFEQRPSGERVEHDPADIWHLRGPSWNSWMGLEAVKLAREAIGLAMAIESQQAETHRNGARVSGLYSVKEKMGPEKFEQLAAWMARFKPGGDKAGDTMLLDQDAKFQTSQMTGVEAQTLESRKHQVEEICREFRVMPIMVGQADKASTYASAEQMFLAHVVHCLLPWYERWCMSADVNLLSEQDRRAGYYTRLNPNALMRGAAKDRGDFYAKALGAGGTPAWMSQDEIRALEELDPRGGKADELSDGAMKPAATPPAQEADPNAA